MARPALPQRRRLLQAAGGAFVTVPLAPLLGCTGGGTAAGDAAAAAPTDGDGGWASGGTASIDAAARAVDPFAGLAATAAGACVLTCSATIGPCHAAAPERSDISDGWDGLPMRLALRVLDAACNPVAGAVVEIWHTNSTGGYSGEIRAMCNNDPDDLDKRFFRGWQRTGADGRVDFDSCYPGWYRGRAVHVHVRVMTGGYDGDDRASASVVTQLLFPDALTAGVFADHPLYRIHGQPDTTLATDNVVGGETDGSRFLFDWTRLDDGVLLVSRTLVVRTADDDPQPCTLQGAHGRGPPPGGPRGPGGTDGAGGEPPPGPPPDEIGA